MAGTQYDEYDNHFLIIQQDVEGMTSHLVELLFIAVFVMRGDKEMNMNEVLVCNDETVPNL